MCACIYAYKRIYEELNSHTQVVRGGNLDINFSIDGPDYRLFETPERKSSGFHSFVVDSAGVYQICLDNTFSNLKSKYVYLEVLADDDSGTCSYIHTYA